MTGATGGAVISSGQSDRCNSDQAGPNHTTDVTGVIGVAVIGGQV